MDSKTNKSSFMRTSHSYAGSLYLLPSDEEERMRLQLQHQLYTRTLSGRLIFPPVSFSKNEDVLDIGTGTGAWLCDARLEIPDSVQLYGIDIESRLFPSYPTLSPNVHLSICSGVDLPSYWVSKFTLVHQRFMIGAYSRDQWRRNIAEVHRVLVPDGYVQLIEIGPEWVSGPKTASHILFLDDFFQNRGMLLRCGVCLADMLKAAGFVDVRSEEVTLKLGKWFGEEGVHGRDVMIGAMRGMRDSVMKAGGFGRFASGEEFDKVMDEVAEEWDNTEDSWSAVTVCYGRKPL